MCVISAHFQNYRVAPFGLMDYKRDNSDSDKMDHDMRADKKNDGCYGCLIISALYYNINYCLLLYSIILYYTRKFTRSSGVWLRV